MEHLRFLASLLSDLYHRVDESVQVLLAFGFGWFDHQCFMHDEREVVGWGVETKIHQPFRDI